MADITGSVSRNSTRFVYYLRCTEQDISGGADNRSKVRVGIRIRSAGSSTWAVRQASATHTITINGVNYTATSGAYSLIGGQDIEIASVTSGWIAHNADGSKTINISSNSPDLAQGNGYGPYSGSASGTMTLTKIPRQASITSFLVNKRDETSLTFNFVANSTIDYVWYSTNNGSSWTGLDIADGTTGSFTVSGLTANTTYNCKLRVRRKDSQLTTDSSTVAQTTYDYPYCSNSPNFTVGDRLTLNFYNPLSREVSVYIILADGTEQGGDVITGTSLSGYDDEGWVNHWTNSIPNASNGTYKVKVVYGTTSTKIRDNGNKYTLNSATNSPTFSDFDYEDINPTTLTLTGDNQIIVSGYSNIKAIITPENKAVAKNSATMRSYTLAIGNQTAQANYSDDEAVEMTIQKANSATISVGATDSRSFSTVINKIATIKSYTVPIVTQLTATRSNGNVGEEVTLAFEGTWWNDNFGQVNNAIEEIKYWFKKTTDTTWTLGTTTITHSVSDNTFSGNLLVAGDTTGGGFDASIGYDIKIAATDKLGTSNEYQVTIGSGTPAIAIYKNNVAVGQKYDETLGGTLQLKDSLYIGGIKCIWNE